MFGLGCGWECFWNWDCDDGNLCTFDRCVDNSCSYEPPDTFLQCGDKAVCFDGACVELGGNCTMADLEYDDYGYTLHFVPYGCGIGIGGDPVYEATYDCYEAWADAPDGAEPDCVDFVVDCYLQKPEAAVTENCYRCVASGYCCANLCADPVEPACSNEMFACMLGEQALPSEGGGGRCSAAQQGGVPLAWAFAALALIGIWRTFSKDANRR